MLYGLSTPLHGRGHAGIHNDKIVMHPPLRLTVSAEPPRKEL